jgi:Flp pilus assembly protein TadG
VKTNLIKPLSEKRGGVLVIFAVALIAMMGMAGLALDVAHLYGVKSQLQVAADAAALAGASVLTGPTAVTDATNAATSVGAANYADVYPTGAANAGEAIPVTLNTGDISTGNWNGATFTVNGAPLNAVRVVARRTGASGQPMVVNWLIKVLSVLPGTANFDKTGVTAVAIAARGMSNALPIAVNEYWGNPVPYPHSYMRSIDIDPTHTAGYAGNTFAILGANATDSMSPADQASYVYVDWRNPKYDGSGQWYTINLDASGNPTGNGDCSDCQLPTTTPNGNNMDNLKLGPYFYFLFNGISEKTVPPIAVPEPYNPNMPHNQYYKTQASLYTQPSNCPYATIAYFSSSGNIPKLPLGPGGERFCDQWPIGSRLLVMVYDGTVSANIPQAVTIVGYGVIQIDGYSNGGGSGKVPASLNASGNTAYGHALKITDLFPSLAGDAHLTDPYIITPTSTDTCDSFLSIVKQVKLAQVKLVDSSNNMHYGMTAH